MRMVPVTVRSRYLPLTSERPGGWGQAAPYLEPARNCPDTPSPKYKIKSKPMPKSVAES